MTPVKSAGKLHVGRALWYVAPGRVEIRPERLSVPGPGEALVRTLYSGVSRGTERLISQGMVPSSEWQRMRAPMQAGDFPFPVKYGYCATGVIEDGPDDLVGRTVFCLHPHQDRFVAPLDMLCAVPPAVPARRATLAANMETALNAHWDAATGPSDRIVIVGAGIVGLLVAVIGARLPGADVTVIDIDPGRRDIVTQLGARFCLPADAPADADVVFHTSASAPGLATAIGCAGLESRVVELSWYGDKQIAAPLGGAFHARRVQLISSQVGQVAASRRPRWSYRRRLLAALKLLEDTRLDPLVAEEIAFEETPRHLPALLADAKGLAPVVKY
ncbi:MAG: zinc-binding alcohol dehydrogenase [Hyphomicrobiaceae bacterium]|nr:zinc-binding alcohol dehydrogenase [Hyphomicrobiaceae bacterium]